MGAEDPVREVEDRVVGVRFRVKEAKRDQLRGEILLQCEVSDAALFDRIQRKLDGFKIFSDDLNAEVRDALSEALQATAETVQEKDKRILELQKKLSAAQSRIHYLEDLLTGIGMDLGLE